MSEYYIIDKCPKCGIEIPVMVGSNGGFDGHFEGEVNVECPDIVCKEKFRSGLNHLGNKEYYEVNGSQITDCLIHELAYKVKNKEITERDAFLLLNQLEVNQIRTNKI